MIKKESWMKTPDHTIKDIAGPWNISVKNIRLQHLPKFVIALTEALSNCQSVLVELFATEMIE